MATINVDGFYISGDDYRNFRQDNTVRQMIMSYHWTGASFSPKAYYVRNADGAIIPCEITLHPSNTLPLDSPFGLSTFTFTNYGGRDQFHKLIREAIDEWNSQHPGGPTARVRDISSIQFTPGIYIGPSVDPSRFVVLNMELHFDFGEEVALKMAAASSLTITTHLFQPSPPAQPEDI